MKVGEVYYKSLRSDIFIPFTERDLNGDVLGLSIKANETHLDMPLFGKYTKPYEYTNTKKAIEYFRGIGTQFKFIRIPSADADRYVQFYTPSSKMWVSTGDKYEKIITTSGSSFGKQYTMLGLFQHEEYVDYKTGKGMNPLYYPFGTDFSSLIAYVNGLALSKSGLDSILQFTKEGTQPVKTTYSETMFAMFVESSELASWSINNPRPYNIVVTKQDPPKFTRAMLEIEVDLEKGEEKTLKKVKELIGEDVDEEFLKKVATLDWDKLTKLKKKNPKILTEVAKTIGSIYQTFKQEKEQKRIADEELRAKKEKQKGDSPLLPKVDIWDLDHWRDKETSPPILTEYSYKGYKVKAGFEDVVGILYGLQKNYHLYLLDDTYVQNIDWSRYGEELTENLFDLYIDCGAPDRDHPALEVARKLEEEKGEDIYSYPLTKEDLLTIKDYLIAKDKDFQSLLTQSDFTPPKVDYEAIKDWIDYDSLSVEQKGYEYKGYTIKLEDRLDDDGEVRTYYYIIDSNGFSKPALWNQTSISQNIFRLYIDLGAPDNIADKSQLLALRDEVLKEYEEGKGEEDISKLTEIPDSWWNKIDVEDFGYDKITTTSELYEIIDKKRRSREDKIRLTLLLFDVYVISEDDEKYEDYIELKARLYQHPWQHGSEPKVKMQFKNRYRYSVKYESLMKFFAIKGLEQSSTMPSDEWIIDIPFSEVAREIESLKSQGDIDTFVKYVNTEANLNQGKKPKATKKPKTEIEKKYEKIDFDF